MNIIHYSFVWYNYILGTGNYSGHDPIYVWMKDYSKRNHIQYHEDITDMWGDSTRNDQDGYLSRYLVTLKFKNTRQKNCFIGKHNRRYPENPIKH